MQILRYTKGQKYGGHYDSAYDTKEAGPHHRLATFYMYLSGRCLLPGASTDQLGMLISPRV